MINHRELSALSGLPYLQQLAYIQGLKPYVDYKTGIIGIRRGVSYQSLKEALYIEPHSGIQSGSPSKDQLRRALKGLEKAGLIEIQSWEWKLVFRCLLLDLDNSNQNKPAIKSHHKSTTNFDNENTTKSCAYATEEVKPTTGKIPYPAIPQDSNNYLFIFLNQAFEEFWELYPLKKEKEITFEEFKKINPSQALANEIKAGLQQQILFHHQQQAAGIWMPAWKYPNNWLVQKCWNHKPVTNKSQENVHAINQPNRSEQPTQHNSGVSKQTNPVRYSDDEFQKLWKLH